MRRAAPTAVGLLLLATAPAAAQTYVELRLSTTEYRFVDVSHTFGNGLVLDALYLGVPGQNELYLGAGYQWQASSGLTVTPLVYGVAGKENEEAGLVVGAYVLAQGKGVKALAFLGRFVRLAGSVADYDFLDSLDVTYGFGKRWEAGGSATVYRQDGEWSGLVGPMIRRNDSRGSWAVTVRGGYDTEARIIRILEF